MAEGLNVIIGLGVDSADIKCNLIRHRIPGTVNSHRARQGSVSARGRRPRAARRPEGPRSAGAARRPAGPRSGGTESAPGGGIRESGCSRREPNVISKGLGARGPRRRRRARGNEKRGGPGERCAFPRPFPLGTVEPVWHLKTSPRPAMRAPTPRGG